MSPEPTVKKRTSPSTWGGTTAITAGSSVRHTTWPSGGGIRVAGTPTARRRCRRGSHRVGAGEVSGAVRRRGDAGGQRLRLSRGPVAADRDLVGREVRRHDARSGHDSPVDDDGDLV
jgi:hypothetical protein